MTFDTGLIFCPSFCDLGILQTAKFQTSIIFDNPSDSVGVLVSEGLFSKKEKEERNRQVVQQAVTPAVENPNEFFTFREGVVDRAVKECAEQFLSDEEDGPLLAFFFLTQYVLFLLKVITVL